MGDKDLTGAAGEVSFDDEVAAAAAGERTQLLEALGIAEPQLEELRQKHGDLFYLKVTPKGDEMVVVLAKRPDRPIWRKFQADGNNPSMKSLAMELLVRACVVLPDKKDFDQLLARFPALVRPFSDELLSIAGLEDGTSGKL